MSAGPYWSAHQCWLRAGWLLLGLSSSLYPFDGIEAVSGALGKPQDLGSGVRLETGTGDLGVMGLDVVLGWEQRPDHIRGYQLFEEGDEVDRRHAIMIGQVEDPTCCMKGTEQGVRGASARSRHLPQRSFRPGDRRAGVDMPRVLRGLTGLCISDLVCRRVRGRTVRGAAVFQTPEHSARTGAARLSPHRAHSHGY